MTTDRLTRLANAADRRPLLEDRVWAVAEIEMLQGVIGEASTKLKLLYMAAGLGQKTGRDALSALSDEITKLDAALRTKDQP